MSHRHTPGEVTTCVCGEQILWAETTNLKMMPLNLEPNPAGNAILHPGHKVHIIGPPDRAKPEVRTLRYMPHHATCTRVEEFRR